MRKHSKATVGSNVVALSEEQILLVLDKFRKIIGNGNGSVTIHFAGGMPQKVKADLDGESILKFRSVA